MRRFISLPAAALLVACLAGTVAAAPPVRETFTVTDSNSIDCETFEIVQDFTVVVRTRTFFDPEGNPTHDIWNLHWEGTLTNTTTGFTVRDNAAWTEFFNFATGDLRQAGLVWSLNVPGQGIVALDTGTITFFGDGSVSYNGPHQVFEEGDALLCAVMDN